MQYDLEPRTLKFAKDIRGFIKQLDRTIANFEDGKQLVRSSGSVGANYIEANEALSKKDFLHRIRISKKEAKETIYWLKLIETSSDELEAQRLNLLNEATEIMKILGAIYQKSQP